MRDANPHALRPESHNVLEFARKRGLKSGLIVEEIIGRHGYEQYYHNIYQSMYNFGVKCLSNKRSFRKRFKALVKEYPDDFDYRVAHDGFVAGLRAADVVLDSENYADITELLKMYGMREKSPLRVPAP